MQLAIGRYFFQQGGVDDVAINGNHGLGERLFNAWKAHCQYLHEVAIIVGWHRKLAQPVGVLLQLL